MKIRQQQQNKTKLQQQKKPEKAPGEEEGARLKTPAARKGSAGVGARTSRLEGLPEGGSGGPQQACQWLSGWVRCWTHSPLIHYLPNSLCIPANPSSLGGPLSGDPSHPPAAPQGFFSHPTSTFLFPFLPSSYPALGIPPVP